MGLFSRTPAPKKQNRGESLYELFGVSDDIPNYKLKKVVEAAAFSSDTSLAGSRRRDAYKILSQPSKRDLYDDILKAANDRVVIPVSLSPEEMQHFCSQCGLNSFPDSERAWTYHIRFQGEPGPYDTDRPMMFPLVTPLDGKSSERLPVSPEPISLTRKVDDFAGNVFISTPWEWWGARTLGDSHDGRLAGRFFVNLRMTNTGSVHEPLDCGISLFHQQTGFEFPVFILRIGFDAPLEPIVSSEVGQFIPKHLIPEWDSKMALGRECINNLSLAAKTLLQIQNTRQIKVRVEYLGTTVGHITATPPAKSLEGLDLLIRETSLIG